jgi:hypothetical protein
MRSKHVTKSGVCKLCGQTAELCESHVIPKFVFAWMKETGDRTFRGIEDPNRVLQDGGKLLALCETCEQRFSQREGWFSRSMFRPFVTDGVLPNRQYDTRLFYFLTSLAWRAIVLNDAIPPPDHPNHQAIAAAEREWRKYLLTEEAPVTFNTFHLILTNPADKVNFPIKPLTHLSNFHRWFKRYTDGTLCTNKDSPSSSSNYPASLFSLLSLRSMIST